MNGFEIERYAVLRLFRRWTAFSAVALGACALGGLTGGCNFGPPPEDMAPPPPHAYVNVVEPSGKPWPNIRPGQGSATPTPAPAAPRTELVNIDLSSPKAAAMTYYRAMAYGDAYAARAAVLGDSLTTRYIESATAFSASVRDLYTALSERFGQAAARSNPEFTGYLESFASPDVPRAIASGEVRIVGDTATMTLRPVGVYPGNEEAPAVFRQFFGQWRLAMLASRRLDGIQAEEANDAAITNRRSAVRFAILAKGVRQGRYKNVEEVWGGGESGPHPTFASVPPAPASTSSIGSAGSAGSPQAGSAGLPPTAAASGPPSPLTHIGGIWPGTLPSERETLLNSNFPHLSPAARSSVVDASPATPSLELAAPTTIASARPVPSDLSPSPASIPPPPTPAVAVSPAAVEPISPAVISVPPVVSPPEVAAPKPVIPSAAPVVGPPDVAPSAGSGQVASSGSGQLPAVAELQPDVAAIRKAHLDIVASKLAKGIKINEKDPRGRTMLHSASIAGEDDVVALLLSKGADVKAVDAQGWTALHWAASGGHASVVRELLDAGANINAKDQIGATPLHWAAIFDQHDAAEVLLDRGADVKAKDVQGKTPLHSAAEHDAQQVTPLLLARGASLKAKDDDGDTPLHSVIRHARAALADLEMTLPDATGGATTNPVQASEASAPPELKESRDTIVRHAVEMVGLLLANGADVNARTPGGQTPLHLAAWDDTRELAALLISKGADVDAQNSHNRTPLEIAKERGQNAIVQLLTAKADQ